MKTAPKLLLLALAAASVAAITSRDLGNDLRTASTEIPFWVGTSTDAFTTEGQEGVVWYNAMTTTWTSTQSGNKAPAAMLYPTRLILKTVDAAPAGTVACSSVTIYGTDALGQSKTETVRSINESTWVTTTYSYERVFKMSGSCSGYSTNDKLMVRMSKWLPFPRTVRSIGTGEGTALVSVCRKHRDAGDFMPRCVDDVDELDDFTVHETSNTWDPTTGSVSGGTFERGDRIWFRTRGSRW